MCPNEDWLDFCVGSCIKMKELYNRENVTIEKLTTVTWVTNL